MGFLDTVKGWLRSETSELKDSAAGLRSRIDDDLTRRERQLGETPAEAMARLQDEIADSGSFADVEDRVARAQARADAVSDLADTDRPTGAAATTAGTGAAPSGNDDVLDLDSEEIDGVDDERT